MLDSMWQMQGHSHFSFASVRGSHSDYELLLCQVLDVYIYDKLLFEEDHSTVS